jgi:hypothetical protein
MAIPAFDAREKRIIEAGMIYRYGQPVTFEEADVELKLDPAREELTACPGIYWNERGVQFVVCKTTAQHYRSYFFYTDNEQFRIGEKDYDALEDCVRTLLQLQADHHALRMGVFSDSPKGDPEDDYLGPWLV